MTMFRRFEVLSKNLQHESTPIDKDIFNFLDISLRELKEAKVYWIEEKTLDHKKWNIITNEILRDEILEEIHKQDFDLTKTLGSQPDYIVEVTFLPGVTDNSSRSAMECLNFVLGEDLDVQSGKLFYLFGEISKDQAQLVAEKFLANKLIQGVKVFTPSEYKSSSRFIVSNRPEVRLPSFETFQTYNLAISDLDLEELSKKNVWALTLSEMKVIQSYYQREDVKSERKTLGLPEKPTDVEMEILAQTWSEHCKHKIFASAISYKEKESVEMPIGNQNIDSLYKTFIKGATKDIDSPWLISVFKDNAGIVRFSDEIDLAIKVETHNSPSALDPYGGALTGIVGVNRDILGVGLGARPIANTNVLFFAPPHWPDSKNKDQLPVGLLHPKRVLSGVHKGIEDGGNKSGIPTINGAIYFDYNYAGKPLVYCGTIGVMKQQSSDGIKLSEKYHVPGDHIVMVGGRIGVDGIHGATFSSLELDEESPSTAVQIGDPLTQRRLTDFMMKALELNLYSSVTDNGAGGLSSSVGEMAEKTNGATIDVSLAKTKYPGIKPFELVISESQERMTFAVPKEKLDKFLELAREFNVDASDLGNFTNDGFFKVLYKGELVGALDMKFLHDGLPQMELEAKFEGPYEFSFKEEAKSIASVDQKSLKKIILSLLSSPNISSKEKWVRQYDHEVQASTIVKPFRGTQEISPSNSGVLWLKPHGGKESEAVGVGCGFAPRLSYFDSYLMTTYALDEALRNVICQGAELDKIALIDNFCWPDPIKTQANPDGDVKLGALVRSCKALYDYSTFFKTPFVSGKDSMKNDFKGMMANGDTVKISVPPTLLVTAMGYISDKKYITTTEFKKPGDLVYLIGEEYGGLLYSEFHRYFDSKTNFNHPEYINFEKSLSRYKSINQAQKALLLNSLHDISDGGLIISVIESCFANNLGVSLSIQSENLLECLFSERASRFVCSVSKENKEKFESSFTGDFLYLGEVSEDRSIKMKFNDLELSLPLDEAYNNWSNSNGGRNG